ncbi:hypothetical protein OROGR_020693 [Orobanche gracilis]
MKSYNCVRPLSDPKTRSCLCSLLITVSLICGVYFVGNACLRKELFRVVFVVLENCYHPDLDRKQNNSKTLIDASVSSSDIEVNDSTRNTRLERCNRKCRPVGSEALPEGIVSTSSNLEMRPLWGHVSENFASKHSSSLLAIAVGIKQKRLVNEIVKKIFMDVTSLRHAPSLAPQAMGARIALMRLSPLTTMMKFIGIDFVVMLFHYDGVVDEWRDLEWSNRAIHVSAPKQTKWWFAKRFLHPDIVAEYEYIFLWDEDLGVENFHPGRYISIVKEERRHYKFKGGGRCDDSNTAPPCVGWVEMMAPVFSRAAWRCAWYMIQNDLIHAWGLDMQLGYCAQGDRTMKVGVVDEEYIVHLGLPTLGGFSDNNSRMTNAESPNQSSRSKNLSDSESSAGGIYHPNNRSAYE